MIRTIRKIVFVFLLFATFCIFTGCSEKLESGLVYDKKFTAEHTQNIIIPFVIFNGKTSTVIPIPYIRHYDDDYEIFVEALDDSGKTSAYHVTKEVYEKTDIGSVFVYCKDYCSLEANYEDEELVEK